MSASKVFIAFYAIVLCWFYVQMLAGLHKPISNDKTYKLQNTFLQQQVSTI